MSLADSSPPTGNTVRFLFRLALPVLAEELLNMLVGYTDWWLTSRFLPGDEYQAAMGLMAYFLWMVPSLFAAVAIGATALTARFVGAGDRDGAANVVNQAMLIGGVLAIAATLVVLLGGPWFVRLMQMRGTAAELALRYIAIITPFIPAVMFQQVAAACLRGAGDTVSGLLAKIVVNVVNIVLSASLVLGLGPLPKLGWEGLAIGTACGHGVGALLLLVMLIRGRSGLRLDRRRLRADPATIRRLLRVGLPGGFDVLAILVCHLTYLAIINSLGTAAAAAHGLGVQIEALAYLPGAAFHVAATTMAGQFLGCGQPEKARRGVLLAALVAGLIMTTAGCVFFFGGHVLTRFFTGDWNDPTGLLAARLLKIVALSMPSLAITVVFTGGLRGAGDTSWPLLITLIGLVGVRLPGACWAAWPEVPLPLLGVALPGLDAGVIGVWWAMVADVALRSLLVSLRFFHGGWRRVRV